MLLLLFLLNGFIFASSIKEVEYSCGTLADWNAERLNIIARQKHKTTVEFSRGLVNQFAYNKAVLTGLDSLQRTGPCVAKKQNYCTTYETHFGLGLAILTIGELQHQDFKMTAFARSVKNSVLYRVRVCTKPCKIVVESLQLEHLGHVEFVTSDKNFNYIDLRGVFYRCGSSEIQKYLDVYREKIEKSMKAFSCSYAYPLDNSKQLLFP